MMKFLKKLVPTKTKEPTPLPEVGDTHNFINQGWGHSLDFGKNGETYEHITGHGWCSGINLHDLLAMKKNGGGLIFYMVMKIEYCRDPTDMFFFSASWHHSEDE